MSELIFAPWAESHAFTGKEASFLLLLVKLTIRKPGDPWTDAYCAFKTFSVHGCTVRPVHHNMQFPNSLLQNQKKNKTRIWKHSVKVRAREKMFVSSKRGSRNKRLMRGRAPRQPEYTRQGEFPLCQPLWGIWNTKLLFLCSQLLSACHGANPRRSGLWGNNTHLHTVYRLGQNHLFIYLSSFIVYLKWLGRLASPRRWWFGVLGEREKR